NPNYHGGDTLTVTSTDSNSATHAQTVAITVTSINDAPSGADNSIVMAEDSTHTLAAAEFGFSDVDNPDSLSAVRIDSLPASGSLLLSGVPVTAGQTILAVDLAAGHLVYTPAADDNGSPYAAFNFSVRDQAGA